MCNSKCSKTNFQEPPIAAIAAKTAAIINEPFCTLNNFENHTAVIANQTDISKKYKLTLPQTVL
jgi:hypothetical protein